MQIYQREANPDSNSWPKDKMIDVEFAGGECGRMIITGQEMAVVDGGTHRNLDVPVTGPLGLAVSSV